MQLKIYMSSAAALLGFKLGEGQQRGLALPRMAPKRAAAKAKAAALAARVATSNARRDRRREACRALNQLANELGVGHAGLDAKEASGSEVERLIRLLERRVREDGPLERLRGAAKAFADNGGELSAEVVSEEASLSPFVPKHRVLASFFKLKSKAFMLTYNSNDFAVATWAPFRQFVMEVSKAWGARAWAACLEKSLHSETPDRHHLHAYLLWTDGVGVETRSLDAFYFQDVRPDAELDADELEAFPFPLEPFPFELPFGGGASARTAREGWWAFSMLCHKARPSKVGSTSSLGQSARRRLASLSYRSL